jgi:hypothetical protein
LIGTVSGVAGHLVEGIFAVETAASLLLFWVLLGLGASPLTDDSGPQTERLPELPGELRCCCTGFSSPW